MANFNTQDLAQLRAQTGMGVMEIKNALDESQGNKEKALKILKKKGASIIDKKSGRTASEGLIEAYVHSGRIGVLVEVNCETDFVARGRDFKDFVHDLALQISSMAPATVEELLEQPWIKDSQQTIKDYLGEVTGKLGERIVITRFVRFVLGEEKTSDPKPNQ